MTDTAAVENVHGLALRQVKQRRNKVVRRKIDLNHGDDSSMRSPLEPGAIVRLFRLETPFSARKILPASKLSLFDRYG